MPFTDRYIKVPIKIYNNKEEDLLNKKSFECEEIELELRLNPFKIEGYHPTISGGLDFDSNNVNSTTVIMESGESHLIYLTIEEFEKLLDDFNK